MLYRGIMLRLYITALLLPTMLSLTACIDPCETLSNRICDCRPTDMQREQCRRQVAIQKDRLDPSDEDKATCEAALKTCTCEALERNELSLCGFSR